MVDLREFVRESNAIEDVHEESAVESTIEAWDYLRQKDDLTHDRICTAHQYIMGDRQPDIAGEYRDIQVYVGDRTPPPPVVIEHKMEELLAWEPADPLEAIEWHVAFEQIHPFADGNGRIGRLLYLWHCREKLNVDPVMWRADDRKGYYELFQSTVDVDTK